MDDLIVPGAEYDVRPSLAAYYGKEAILMKLMNMSGASPLLAEMPS